MKKYFLMFLVSSIGLFSANAKAAKTQDHFYFGADIIHSNAETKFRKKSDLSDEDNGLEKHAESTRYGFNAGYNFYCNNFFVAPELFYDKLDLFVPDYFSNLNSPERGRDRQDGLRLNHRVGYKINVGYKIKRFSVFANAGQAKVNWNEKQTACNPELISCDYVNNNNVSNRGSELAMIYGVGATYEIVKHLAVRAAFDYQNFNVGWRRGSVGSESSINKVTIKTTRIGLVYRF